MTLSIDESQIDKRVIDRDKVILDFIIEHPGCSNANIKTGLNGQMGRTVISRHVKALLKEGLILNKSNAKNKNVLVSNKSNEISFVEEKLMVFKRQFDILLEKSLKYPQTKFAIDMIKKGEISVNDSLSAGSILKKIYSQSKKSHEIYLKIDSLREEIIETSTSLKIVKSTGKGSNIDKLQYRGSTPGEILKNRLNIIRESALDSKNKNNIVKINGSHLKEISEHSKIVIYKIETLKKLQNQYSNAIKSSAYLILTYWPVFLYFFVSYYLTIRGLLVWPKKIVDKKMLFELNEFVYQNLEEIKNRLLGFLAETKSYRIKSEMELLMNSINFADKDYYFKKIINDYSILNMKEEVVRILDSLNQSGEGDNEYEYIEKYIESIYSDFKSILNLCRSNSNFL